MQLGLNHTAKYNTINYNTLIDLKQGQQRCETKNKKNVSKFGFNQVSEVILVQLQNHRKSSRSAAITSGSAALLPSRNLVCWFLACFPVCLQKFNKNATDTIRYQTILLSYFNVRAKADMKPP